MEMNEIRFPIELVNNDGTSMDDFPKNPLEEKWDKLYNINKYGTACSPVLGEQEDGTPIMNYGCVLCHSKRCHRSDSFVVPEEDREVYNQYQLDVERYMIQHGNIPKPEVV